MKVDMHIHTVFSHHPVKSDSSILMGDLVEYGKTAGLDGLVIMDHMNFSAGLDELECIRKKSSDFLLLRGFEYHSDSGHLLVYGIENDCLIKKFGKYSKAQDFIDSVNELGGIAVPAHPYYKGYTHEMCDNLFRLRGFDTIEVINGSKCLKINKKAIDVAKILRLKGIGGSDAHKPYDIGTAYTVFKNPISDMSSLLSELKSGNFHAELAI